LIEADPELDAAVTMIADGEFSRGDRGIFAPLLRELVDVDPYFVLADFRAYVDAQRQVSRAWSEPDRWVRMSILNVARMGFFSSDRSIRQYAERVWDMSPEPVPSVGGPTDLLHKDHAPR
jgi:starch phosphorylase